MTTPEIDPNSQIAILMQEILDACQNNALRTDVALSNLIQLKKAIEKYDQAPKYYNTFFEKSADSDFSGFSETSRISDHYKYPIIGELEKAYGKHMKKTDLDQLAKRISVKTSTRLTRDSTLTKDRLLEWFSQHWSNIRQECLNICSEMANS